jgi:hypothetical protein
VAGDDFADSGHPYAPDLDLFGHGSVFERLCSARSGAGQARLAAFLSAPADAPAVRARQNAVRALRDRLDLRETLALIGKEETPRRGRSRTNDESLAAWGEAPTVLPVGDAHRAVAGALAALGVATLAAGGLGHGWLMFVVALLAGQIYVLRLGSGVRTVLRDVERRAGDLSLLAGLLAHIEREPITDANNAPVPLLADLRQMLHGQDGQPPPSVRLRGLQTRIEWHQARHNPFFAPAALVLLWDAQFAFALESWRRRNGPRLRGWIEAAAAWEALCALAGYTYERPDDPFPEIADIGPLFEADGLAHPLLSAASAIRNDVRLGGEHGPRLLLVSGSNMSGKSTLLRAIGVNVVLALAGAPVRAIRLRLSPLSIGASLRTQDSLQEGVSRFYAEILRLKQIVDIAERGPYPLLFLLDEILAGTNSADRRAGADALVRALVEKGAIGLVTTHDLALTRLVESLGDGRAANVHFEDHLDENGRITFDYRLRPGVVEKSNALALMRAVGLDV